MDACERTRGKTNSDWEKRGGEKIRFIRASEKESVGLSGNRAANFVDGFIGDGAAVTKRDGAREGVNGGGVTSSSGVSVIK